MYNANGTTIFSEAKIKSYKKKFDRDLKHVKIILTNERKCLPHKEWLCLVDEIKKSILSCPHDFFCYELPPDSVMTDAIGRVFDGFLEDQRLREIQALVHFKIPSNRT